MEKDTNLYDAMEHLSRSIKRLALAVELGFNPEITLAEMTKRLEDFDGEKSGERV